MKIAIRREPNGNIYIDKKLRSDINYTEVPYNFKIIDIGEEYIDCQGSDFTDDLTFSIEKYISRREREKINDYENKVVIEIRKKYNINQELAILRQRDSKPQEFAEYSAYVEQCKAKIKQQ